MGRWPSLVCLNGYVNISLFVQPRGFSLSPVIRGLGISRPYKDLVLVDSQLLHKVSTHTHGEPNARPKSDSWIFFKVRITPTKVAVCVWTVRNRLDFFILWTRVEQTDLNSKKTFFSCSIRTLLKFSFPLAGPFQPLFRERPSTFTFVCF